MKDRLKILYVAFIIFCIALVSCSTKEVEVPPFLKITPENVLNGINFDAKESVRTINVSTNVEGWSVVVEPGATWLTYEKTEKSVVVKVTENKNIKYRKGSLTVKAGSLTETIKVEQLGIAPAILIGTEIYRIKSNGEIIDIEVTSNIEYDIIIPEDVDWIVKADMQTRNEMITANYKYEIKPNDDKERRSIISIKGKNDNINRSIEVIQDKFEVDLDKETSKDVRISVLSAKVENNEFQPGAGIERTIDGDYNTSFHTRWSGSTVFPVVFSYHFKEGVAQDIDYALLYGTTSYNGKIKEMNVYVKEFGSNEVQFGKTLDLKGEGGNQFVDLGLKNVEYVKFEVLSGTGTENGYVAFREIEFFKEDPDKTEDYAIFTDSSCSELKRDVKAEDIDKISSSLLRSIAKELYNKTYDSRYRVAQYKAIPSPDIIAENLKIGNGFSHYEGITGMFLRAGKAAVLVGDTKGEKIYLRLPNLMRKPIDDNENDWSLHNKKIQLREGINIVDVEYDANAYLEYFVDSDTGKETDITVHFPVGEVNGYFDFAKHNNKDWNDLLDNAVSPIMDMKGKYIHVAYPVEYFKKFTFGKGVELINNYDKMLHSHYKFMGLEKYNRLPNNRIFSRVNFHYYMFRDGDGVAYLGNESTMNMVASPSVVIKGDPCWGFSHEVGHVLQMRPQLNWGGLGEVSNNLFSLYTTTGLGNISRLKEGNTYKTARNEIFGKDKSYLHSEDVFIRLVPFWQLHLFFSENGKPDFYADVMEEMRNRPHSGTGNEAIRNQFEFMKIACEVGKLDLTDFFDKWGFFYVGKIEIGDYGTYKYNITQQEVDYVKEYIKNLGFEKPKQDITLVEDK